MARPISVKPFLWFESQAEEAAAFYASLIPGSRVVDAESWTEVGSRPARKLRSATVDLAGLTLVLFNGGPHFKLNEAFSLSIECETQEEVDHYWAKLTADGGSPSPCGWCKDRFGVSWQVVPTVLLRLLQDPDAGRSARAAEAMMTMQKIDIAALERAAAGG